MSATLQHLHNLWGQAMLDDDLDAARRWREAREHLEVYEARHAMKNPCTTCPWVSSDTCRTCPLSGVKV
jgi:hypothetical protein